MELIYEAASTGILHITNSGAVGPSYVAIRPQNANQDFSNFIYAVDMKVLKGFGGGIIFRASLDQSYELGMYYYFLVGTDGSYDLEIRDNNGSRSLLSSSTSAIHTGLNQTNLVGTIARGPKINTFQITATT